MRQLNEMPNTDKQHTWYNVILSAEIVYSNEKVKIGGNFRLLMLQTSQSLFQTEIGQRSI